MQGEPVGQDASPAGAPTTGGPGRRIHMLRTRGAGGGGRAWWMRLWRKPSTRAQWLTLGVCGLLVASLIGGVAWYWASKGQTEQDYVEVYVTDLPANFTKLEVRVAGVFVGSGDYPLVLDQATFDLLQLRGPSDALRVASGYVPSGTHDEIRVVFHSARAELNGRFLELEIPNSVLAVGHQFGLGSNPSSAFLFDINVDRSVKVSADGLMFEPHVDSVYVHHYGGKPGDPNGPNARSSPGAFAREDAKPFTNQSAAESPERQNLEQPNARIKMNVGASSSAGTTTTKPKFQWNAPTSSGAPSTTTTTQEEPPQQTTEDPITSLPSPGGADSVPHDPADVAGWWAHFHNTYNETEIAAGQLQRDIENTIELAGGVLLLILASEPIAYFYGTAQQAADVAESEVVELVEGDTLMNSMMATSRSAIRLPQVSDPVLGLRDAAGNPLDGRGVGVAVIDLGIDGSHPDLAHHSISTNPAVVANYKVESIFTVDALNTDTTSGHGTHVAGIVAGRGILDPTQKGVAPGVAVYGFGIGEGSTTLWPVTALDWVVQNHDAVSPEIRVVTNSWGTFEPSATIQVLVGRLVAEGVVVVFSAGNQGGDGSVVKTSYQCRIPVEGVLCVAATDDQNLGSRDGPIASYSSRGAVATPASWPDVSAPGTMIRSTRNLAGTTPLGTGLLNRYVEMSGTSMAAPHVAGVAVLMLQARPDLSPAQVEAFIESSAYEFANGGGYASSSDERYNGSHYAKGHGLVDAYAAIHLAQMS